MILYLLLKLVCRCLGVARERVVVQPRGLGEKQTGGFNHEVPRAGTVYLLNAQH